MSVHSQLLHGHEVLGEPSLGHQVRLGDHGDDGRAAAVARQLQSCSAMNRSPGPTLWSAGRQKPTTSTSVSVSVPRR